MRRDANQRYSETLSWDVRTKYVTFDAIPTAENIRGMAIHGPGNTLFTIGPNGIIQQFDLNIPAALVANVQHPVNNMLPPSPPNSIEEQANRSVHSTTTIHTTESESSIPVEMTVSESDEDHMSPYARIARQQVPESSHESYGTGSPISSRSGMSSISKSSAGSRTPGRHHGSVRSRAMTDNTYISDGTSLKSSTIGRNDRQDADNYSMGYSLGTTSVSSMASSSRSRRRPSRLRNEVPRSPEESGMVHDLFKYTRTRLSDMPYKSPNPPDGSRLTNDDLRRQMLSGIFGWQGEVEDLIRDEMSRQPSGSTGRILLAKWLGETETDLMGAGAQNMTSSDWMLLALSGMGNDSSQQKLGRVYIQRLLETGDIHVAVTIMLGMGDQNDAIEIYISHKRYMEALILACLSFPGVWERQAAIIRKWGEWAVQHGQQQLAIRCFACTEQEPTEAWRSPSAVQLNFVNTGTPSIPEVLSPPLSPPGQQFGPQRSIAKTSALKLITSFGDHSQKAKFYNEHDGGATPIAGGNTPIVESATSPGANEITTAFIRPSNNSRFNTPTSAKPGARGRLPSIGEVTSGFDRENFVKSREKEKQAGHQRMTSSDQDNLAAGIALHRSATASPMMMRDNFKKVVASYQVERPPSPDRHAITRMQEANTSRRNGSRDRIPRGINLQIQPLEQQNQIDTASTEQSVASSTRFHWPSRRRGPGSVASSVTSASSAGRSYRHHGGHAKKDHINSIDAARDYSRRSRSRHASKERNRDGSRDRHESKERKPKSKPREQSQDRGRASARSWTQPRRSPTSPIPMSPEDLANLSTPKHFDALDQPNTIRKVSGPSTKSRASSKGRSEDGRRRLPTLDTRSKSKGRDGSRLRSPTSPVPLSASALNFQGSEDEEDYKRAMEEREAFRAKHSRSASRGLNSPAPNRHERSQSRRREAAEAADVVPPMRPRTRNTSTEHAGDLRRMGDERQRKKEQAAVELEERRKSLAKRAETPKFPHPESYDPYMRVGVEAADERVRDDLPPRCATEPPQQSMYARSGPSIGLPATPKAMRLIMENGGLGSSNDQLSPEVPEIPSTFAEKHIIETSPQKETPPEIDDRSSLFLLPSTVYQPPAPDRGAIPRSMSAPIPDELPHHSRHRRQKSQTIDELVQPSYRNSREEAIPPPPPPPPSAPPLLRELQHLAVPPPPPPAPLPYASRLQTPSCGAMSPGIEIVTDEDDAMVAAPNDNMVPVLPPPAPRPRHNRGRSTSEISRVGVSNTKARSVSRSRPIRSPSVGAPHEHYGNQLRSPVMSPPPVMYDQDAIRSPIEPQGHFSSNGFNHSKMI